MSLERETTEQVKSTQQSALQPSWYIDVDTFKNIEITKNNLLINLSEDNIDVQIELFNNLLSDMIRMVEKYNYKKVNDGSKIPNYAQIANQKINGYSIYDVKGELSKLKYIRKSYIKLIACRKSIEIAYTNYDLLIRPIISIPTIRQDYFLG